LSFGIIVISAPTLIFLVVLVIYRLHHYRAQTAGLLQLNKTTRSRFLHLFIMATVVLLLLLPVETYLLFNHALDHRLGPLHPYSWSLVHNDWNVIIFLSSKAVPVYWNRYGWIVYGYIVFAFFGLGKDAKAMYGGWLISLGLGRIFPSLLQPKGSSESSTWFRDRSSKMKMLANKQISTIDSRYGLPFSLVLLVFTNIFSAWTKLLPIAPLLRIHSAFRHFHRNLMTRL
jgi:pheromone a factor receptor